MFRRAKRRFASTEGKGPLRVFRHYKNFLNTISDLKTDFRVLRVTTRHRATSQRKNPSISLGKAFRELEESLLVFLALRLFPKIGPSGAYYYFCFNLSLIIESYLEYQYTPV